LAAIGCQVAAQTNGMDPTPLLNGIDVPR
jgi:hypothetical protein